MRCPNCKKQLREGAKFCPACGERVKQRKGRREVAVFLTIVLLLGAIAGGLAIGISAAKHFGSKSDNALKTLSDSHKAELQKDMAIFSDGNIAEITERVFGIETDSTLTADSDNGIIAELFTNADMQIASTDEESITYVIVSPDISGFFQVQATQLQSITTTGELRQALIRYAETASKKEYTVVLPYIISDEGEVEVAYDNPEFINAMTGGLLDAYAELYNQFLEEAE